MTTFSNDDVIVTIDDLDIIRLKWTEGMTISEESARRGWNFVNQISADRKRPMIVDMSMTAKVTREARTVFLDPSQASIIALLGRSPVDRVIANFVLGVSNMPCPTKFFTSLTAAIDWVHDIRAA